MQVSKNGSFYNNILLNYLFYPFDCHLGVLPISFENCSKPTFTQNILFGPTLSCF